HASRPAPCIAPRPVTPHIEARITPRTPRITPLPRAASRLTHLPRAASRLTLRAPRRARPVGFGDTTANLVDTTAGIRPILRSGVSKTKAGGADHLDQRPEPANAPSAAAHAPATADAAAAHTAAAAAGVRTLMRRVRGRPRAAPRPPGPTAWPRADVRAAAPAERW